MTEYITGRAKKPTTSEKILALFSRTNSWLTAGEIAERTGLSSNIVIKLVRNGVLEVDDAHDLGRTTQKYRKTVNK